MRLKVKKDNGNAFWIDVEMRLDPSLALTNLGSAVVDLYYDNTELIYSSSMDYLAQRREGTFLRGIDPAEIG